MSKSTRATVVLLTLVFLATTAGCGSLKQIDRAAKKTLAAVTRSADALTETTHQTRIRTDRMWELINKILYLVYIALALILYRYVGKFKLSDLKIAGRVWKTLKWVGRQLRKLFPGGKKPPSGS